MSLNTPKTITDLFAANGLAVTGIGMMLLQIQELAVAIGLQNRNTGNGRIVQTSYNPRTHALYLTAWTPGTEGWLIDRNISIELPHAGTGEAERNESANDLGQAIDLLNLILQEGQS